MSTPWRGVGEGGKERERERRCLLYLRRYRDPLLIVFCGLGGELLVDTSISQSPTTVHIIPTMSACCKDAGFPSHCRGGCDDRFSAIDFFQNGKGFHFERRRRFFRKNLIERKSKRNRAIRKHIFPTLAP